MALAAAAGCRKGGETTSNAERTVAEVGGRKIAAADVYRALYPQGKPRDAKPDAEAVKRVVDQLVERALVLEWAAENGVSVKDEEVSARLALIEADYGARSFESYLKIQGLTAATFRDFVKDDLTVEAAIEIAVVKKVSVSYDDVAAYYNANGEQFESPAEYHLRQIVTPDREKADAAIKKLEFGAMFEDVAAELSTSPERHLGGDIGYTKLDALPEEVAKAVAALAPGQVSAVIETPYGFEIVKVLSVREAGRRPLAEVRTDIEDRLRREREAELYTRWVKGLRDAAKVKVNDAAVAQL